jgi:hypothetical protein
VSRRGIDVSGDWVGNIFVLGISASAGKNYDAKMLDEIWRAAEEAQKKRTDGKAVQG